MLISAIRFELDRMLEEGRGTGWRYLEAQKDLEEVMGCYHRIKGHLERLTVSIIQFVDGAAQTKCYEAQCGPKHMEDCGPTSNSEWRRASFRFMQ